MLVSFTVKVAVVVHAVQHYQIKINLLFSISKQDYKTM